VRTRREDQGKTGLGQLLAQLEDNWPHPGEQLAGAVGEDENVVGRLAAVH
jgi:hypothetical protein